ncbi:MAG: AMP-binding protein [Fuerstiella sp.]|jgi:acyl-CoA synthetase (AMP-forming)/AMP-acid ligase II|nr:AMP-binding protein [Fuerstiella sp.]
MRKPLTIRDFSSRAGTVFSQRSGVVDDPDQVSASLGELSYGDVVRLARAQAATLDAMGIGPGERVAIVSKNSARLLVSFFGVSGFGRVLVPINFRLNRAEISYIVEHSGATLLLVDAELDEALAGIGPRRIILDHAGDRQLFHSTSEPQAWNGSEDEVATINYTSGTTARPKGVCLTHRNLWINATVFGLHLTVTEQDVYLHTLPMFHCNGWGMPYLLAGMGARQIVLRNVDGAEILRRVAKYGVTLMCMAPTVVAAILDAAGRWDAEIPGRDRVRIVVAGAPPPTELIVRVQQELGWEFIQAYGLTETSPILTVNRTPAEDQSLSLSDRAKRLGCAGPPVLGASLRISDEDEVLAQGNVVLDRYWDDPVATDHAIRDDWFYTGDSGYVGENGFLTIADRRKDVIITGGENVASIEVEDTLFSHPAVAEVAVIGLAHEKWGETVAAIVVLNSDAAATEGELIDFARQRLAHFKCPTIVRFCDALPRTATGKVQKYKLRVSQQS